MKISFNRDGEGLWESIYLQEEGITHVFSPAKLKELIDRLTSLPSGHPMNEDMGVEVILEEGDHHVRFHRVRWEVGDENALHEVKITMREFFLIPALELRSLRSIKQVAEYMAANFPTADCVAEHEALKQFPWLAYVCRPKEGRKVLVYELDLDQFEGNKAKALNWARKHDGTFFCSVFSENGTFIGHADADGCDPFDDNSLKYVVFLENYGEKPHAIYILD